MKRQIAILGSTGSIGTQALQVIKEHPDLYEVYALTANNQVDLLARQAREFQPEAVVIANEDKYPALKEALSDLPVKVYAGKDALAQIVESQPIDIVLTAMVGYAGLLPTMNAIRAGKANPKILDCVKVMYYGAPAPLSSVASVTVPDARTIMITPWEKKIIRDIEKAILDSEVGITPENNGEVIRLGIPPLTEERRRQLVKQCKQEAENAKISIRNARRDAIDALKKSVKAEGVPEDVAKDAEGDVQKIHDKYIKKVDDLYAAKEKEIMTV